MATNKTPIQHAFGVEPMYPEDLPTRVTNKFRDLGDRVGLHLEDLHPDDDLCFSARDLDNFFQAVVEDCAVIAETQARIYSNGDAGDGCHRAASAIRTYGKQHG